jgi:hypothetical protein
MPYSLTSSHGANFLALHISVVVCIGDRKLQYFVDELTTRYTE